MKYTKQFHLRNRHSYGYNFSKLCEARPQLRNFLVKSAAGHETIDFANPEAVLLLNAALLESEYNIRGWAIPAGQLCPPVPSRADYIHHAADLLKLAPSAKLLDIGTGANGIYALLAAAEYSWKCVGTDINSDSLHNLEKILETNSLLKSRIELRLQPDKHAFFKGIIQTDEFFDISVCNPPFHASAEEAAKANMRKVKNLGLDQFLKDHSDVNFGGIDPELWCKGGEALFLKKMVKESLLFAHQCRWFTALVSKQEHIKPLEKQIKKANATDMQILEMKHGQKKSRILAWTFL